MFFPNNVSQQSISIFFAGGMRSIPESDAGFAELAAHLALPEHDYDFVERLVDKPKMIARMTEGLVSVVGSTVYYNGMPAHSTLTQRLLDILEAGQNAQVWARFLERVMANPSPRSRQCLYEFLDKWKAPLTEDGCFIAFKRVRANYFDIHSNSFDNSPGNTVEVSRDEVDDDPDVTCSSGLHVAATSYLGQFYSSTEGYKVVACIVDPADVVAVPRDYGSAKMRVCKYVVMGDAEESFFNNADSSPIYQGEAGYKSDDGDGDEYDNECPECFNSKASWQSICDDCQAEQDEQEEQPYCSDCGNYPVDEEDDICDACAQEEMDRFHERSKEDSDAIDEEDCIAETGCTRDGVPVSTYIDANDDINLDDLNDKADTETSEMVFMRAGTSYTSTEIMQGVKGLGQRGYSASTGIPRTTLQDWITKIEVCS